jgi:hypothetical protein
MSLDLSFLCRYHYNFLFYQHIPVSGGSRNPGPQGKEAGDKGGRFHYGWVQRTLDILMLKIYLSEIQI